MELQTAGVLAIVTGAALYLASKVWRTVRTARRAADGCGAACGCGEDRAAH